MDFEASKSMFMDFTHSISSDLDRYKFFQWLKEEVLPEVDKSCAVAVSANGDQGRVRRNSEGVLPGTVMIDKIAGDIRSQIPLEAVLQSENIIYPSIGEDSNLTATNTVHVDAFLYDETAEEALVQEGLLARSYCQDCGSRKIEDLTFITHSCSKERLEFMFTNLLPPLAGKTLIDIGSRIGAVLYGAYYYSGASKIIGIEINSDLCRLQRAVMEKYQLGDRMSVVEADMCSMETLIKTGDVVVLNNVFDWFMSPELQVTMWRFLRSALTPGSLLVTIPSLQSSLQHLNTGIDISTWVTQLQPFNNNVCDQVETSEVCLYQVRG